MNFLLLLATIFLVACGSPEASDYQTPQSKAEVAKQSASFSLTVNQTLQTTCKDKNTAALTIDDHITEEALEVLAQNDIRVTFFPIAKVSNKNLVDRALALGHGVGNHTYSHANLTLLSNQEIKAELQKADEVLGLNTAFFRPPWGAYNQNILDIANKTAIGWVDSADRETYQAIAGIVLLHEVIRLQDVIDTHTKAGIKLVTLAECLKR